MLKFGLKLVQFLLNNLTAKVLHNIFIQCATFFSPQCLMHLEDCLQQLYFKSTLMAAYLDKNPTSCHKDLSMSLGMETSDIPLLLGVTSVHAPQVIMNVLRETFEKQEVDVP